MHHRRLAGLAAGLLVLVAAAPAATAAAPANVTVRVEGQTGTLVEETGLRTTLAPGEYAINPPGVWHTADVPEQATGFFVTCGMGTQGRPR